MSRTGKKPVTVPSGVTASIADGQLSVKGPKGTLAIPLADEVTYNVEDGKIAVQPANDSKRARAFWGMQRTLIANLITGVTEGHQEAADHRRRLSCECPGQDPEAAARLQP